MVCVCFVLPLPMGESEKKREFLSTKRNFFRSAVFFCCRQNITVKWSDWTIFLANVNILNSLYRSSQTNFPPAEFALKDAIIILKAFYVSIFQRIFWYASMLASLCVSIATLCWYYFYRLLLHFQRTKLIILKNEDARKTLKLLAAQYMHVPVHSISKCVLSPFACFVVLRCVSCRVLFFLFHFFNVTLCARCHAIFG